MANTKGPRKASRKRTVVGLKNPPLGSRDQAKVKGGSGKIPTPGGPVPIPYPNVGLKSS